MAYWASYIGFSIMNTDSVRLSREARGILASYDDKIAWLRPSYMHLTLQYIGWLNDADAKKILNIISEYKLYDIVLKTTGNLVFVGFDAKEKYIALEVKPTKELLLLRENLGNAMMQLGILFKEQIFLPHISLGRINGINDTSATGIDPSDLKPATLGLFQSISDSMEVKTVS